VDPLALKIVFELDLKAKVRTHWQAIGPDRLPPHHGFCQARSQMDS
jgi:hypothetical protein